jgi:hypothetical protein
MIFQHTWQKVLSGEKTQTRRIVKPGQYQRRDFDLPGAPIVQVAHTKNGVVGTGTPVVYNVGSTYAVQPARTAKAIARIRILSIRREDVRDISADDAFREGYGGIVDFLRVWTSMHDKSAVEFPNLRYLYDRPAEHYQAWVLTFELVKGGAE